MRIAMWSGPRNLSTAMMYAFGARADTGVWDEPFYAAYLSLTGLDHPMRADVLAAGEVDPTLVARACSGSAPGGETHFYQKHMTHHMIPGIDRSWIRSCRNVFLIRHPARVIASYVAKRQTVDLADIGFSQQAEIFDLVSGWEGEHPLVVDSEDIRRDPEAVLRLLCQRLGISFDPAMLRWPAGGHKDDGIWAKHWYGAVWNSTGFAGEEGPLPELHGAAAKLCAQALPFYERLRAGRLVPDQLV